MKNLFKISGKILKNNLIYIQPLLLYVLLGQLAVNFIMINRAAQLPKITLLISLFLLTVIFFAGWFNINKLAVISYNPDDSDEVTAKKSIENLKSFVSGVGEYFVKFLCGLTFFITTAALGFYATIKLCAKTYGIPTSFIENMNAIAQANPEDITSEYLINMSNSIPFNEQLIITEWTGTIFLLSTVLFFAQNIYFTSLIIEKSNFLVCIIKSIKFFFKNFFGNILIALTAVSVFFIFNTISLFTMNNPILFIISFLLLLFFLNFYIIIMLKYYYDKTQTGSNNGPECVGENGFSD